MQKLAVKLIEVMKACKYVVKNGVNAFHKYKYATSTDVLEKVNAAFTKQGIATIVVPEIVQDSTITTAKAVMKAQTAALKYAYMLSLAIATGDDPESDEKTDESMNPAKKSVPVPKLQDSTNPVNPIKTNSVSVKKDQMPRGGYSCYDCGIKINERVADYSYQKFGKYLCMECQKNNAVV